jgi:hypothetical protein
MMTGSFSSGCRCGLSPVASKLDLLSCSSFISLGYAQSGFGKKDGDRTEVFAIIRSQLMNVLRSSSLHFSLVTSSICRKLDRRMMLISATLLCTT